MAIGWPGDGREMAGSYFLFTYNGGGFIGIGIKFDESDIYFNK